MSVLSDDELAQLQQLTAKLRAPDRLVPPRLPPVADVLCEAFDAVECDHAAVHGERPDQVPEALVRARETTPRFMADVLS
jgi:hypothetical protein